MKAVLISIQPKWCGLIASGKKTVEVRKTRPKLDVPFKVYIYCTKPRHYFKISKHLLVSDESLFLVNGKVKMCDGFGVEYEDREYKHLNYKVIGEFVCDEITEYEGEFYDDETQEYIKKVIHTTDWDGYPEIDYNFIAENGEENSLCKSSCLTWEELRNYMGAGINTFYGWHITDLVIYDKPKDLSEFMGLRKTKFGYAPVKITRPPQSWCYVEERLE